MRSSASEERELDEHGDNKEITTGRSLRTCRCMDGVQSYEPVGWRLKTDDLGCSHNRLTNRQAVEKETIPPVPNKAKQILKNDLFGCLYKYGNTTCKE